MITAIHSIVYSSKPEERLSPSKFPRGGDLGLYRPEYPTATRA